MQKKKWTVLAVYVARGFDNPLGKLSQEIAYLNVKADENIAKLQSAAGAAEADFHVAYRVIWDPGSHMSNGMELNPHVGSEPHAEVIGGKAHEGWFAPFENLTMDLEWFLKWALHQCPAEHYAVVFWGHSCGPAGLFRAGLEVPLPQHAGLLGPQAGAPVPGQQVSSRMTLGDVRHAVRDAADFLTLRRLLSAETQLHQQPLLASHAAQKFDLVLFQSCWMSTLETAFQLKDCTKHVLASQSVVPFGKPSVPTKCTPAEAKFHGVWPVSEMLAGLKKYDGSSDSLIPTLNALMAHYSADSGAETWPDPIVTFSLLNLEAIEKEAWKSVLGDLVVGLAGFRSSEKLRYEVIRDCVPVGVVPSSAVCSAHSDGHYMGAGASCLVDLRQLCVRLEALQPGAALLSTIHALRESKLVVAVREVVNPRFQMLKGPQQGAMSQALPLNFGGVSFLYLPPDGAAPTREEWRDAGDAILKALRFDDDSYQNLAICEEVSGWMDFVMEQDE